MDIMQSIKDEFNSAGDALQNMALENIKHRFDDKTTEKVVKAFEYVKDLKAPKESDYAESGLYEAIEQQYGIKIKIEPFNDINAYVPFDDIAITANSPLSPDWPYGFGDNGTKLLRKKKSHEITVNRRTGYISGIEDLTHTIGMGHGLAGKGSGYTARQAAAVFMHELGHIWTYYELLPHMQTSLFLMHEFTETLVGLDSEEAKIILVKQAEKEFGLEMLEKERLIKTDDVREASLIIHATDLVKLRSMFGKNPYDERNSEALADQFVIRHGLGRDLYTAMEKLYRDFGILWKAKSWGRAINNFFSLLINVILAFTPFGVLTLLLMMVFSEYQLREIYDGPKKRLEVMIHGLRDRYKQAPNGKLKEALRKEIQMLEANLDKVDELSDWFEVFFKHILPFGRGEARKLHLSMALESLSNNRLTTRADSLRNVT